jgi:hypothetical protein
MPVIDVPATMKAGAVRTGSPLVSSTHAWTHPFAGMMIVVVAG